MDPQSNSSFLGRHEFLIRRLHSASGLVPVGAYMCVHLLTNASVLGGAASFQDNVDAIHSLGPALPLVEWTFIFIPILFHALVGVVIAVNCETNTGAYRYGGNVRYTLQRVTAWIALFFIGWHVFHMHGWVSVESVRDSIRQTGMGAKFIPTEATSTTAVALAPLIYRVFYFVGVVACTYHLANGIWTAGITWGLWTTPASQRRANYVCAAFGILITVVGLGALVGFGRVDLEQARAVEAVRREQAETASRRARELQSTPEPASASTDSGTSTAGG